MPHFRVDDALHSHPKAQRAGDDAMGMWTRAGSYCMAYLTDGFVPEWWVKQQPKGFSKAQKLVAVGLWHDGAERDGETGYEFHEFVGPGRQDSREKIEADRELARKRKEKSRRDTHRDEPCDIPVTNTVTPHVTNAVSHGEPPGIPNPTQPITVVTFGEGGHESNARDPNAPLPNRCPEHRHDPDPPNCGGCADARRTAEQLDRQAEAERTGRRADRIAEITACPDCDDHGWIDRGNRVTRCPNHRWETTDA